MCVAVYLSGNTRVYRFTCSTRLKGVRHWFLKNHMKSSYGLLLAFFALMPAGGADQFMPSHRISGIGVSRDDISPELLDARTVLMIESKTFSIMREAEALPGAKRVT